MSQCFLLVPFIYCSVHKICMFLLLSGASCLLAPSVVNYSKASLYRLYDHVSDSEFRRVLFSLTKWVVKLSFDTRGVTSFCCMLVA